jgi:hypothetical protein
MASIIVNIPDSIAEKCKAILNLKNNTELASEAFTMLNWIVDEKIQNRIILSSTVDGTDLKRLAVR